MPIGPYHDPESNNPPRRRFQFSLRTALLLIALAAVGISLWVSNRMYKQNEQLRADNIRLRNEVGEINVEEGGEYKLHAIRAPGDASRTWKWRVFVPAGHTFYLNAVLNQIPAAGDIAMPSSQVMIPQGYQTISLELRKNDRNQWQWDLRRRKQCL